MNAEVQNVLRSVEYVVIKWTGINKKQQNIFLKGILK